MRKLMLLISSLVAAGLVVVVPAALSPQIEAVSVTIHRVRQIDNLDKELDISGADRADFFARISVNGQPTKTPVVSSDDVRPYWRALGKITGRYVPITIELVDDDGGIIENKDDIVDINGRDDARMLHLTYDTYTGRVTGDVRGRRGSMLTSRGYKQPSGQIWFTVE